MKITLNAIPKVLSSYFLRPEKILSDQKCTEYIEKMKDFIFGKETVKNARLLGLDLFTLVFYKDMPFREHIKAKFEIKDNEETILGGFLINYLTRGKFIRIMPLFKEGDEIFMGDLTFIRLSIIDTNTDYKKMNNRILKKTEKNEKKKYDLSRLSEHYLETVRMGIVKYYMRKVINEKVFLDKINYRRFSTGLRLNNRPADMDSINALLRKRKNLTFIDLTDTSARLNLSALYTVTYHNVDIKEIYDSGRIFTPLSNSKTEEVYSKAASDFINIIYNGNGIEICDVLVKMAIEFSKVEMPKIAPDDLYGIIKNYTVIYAAAAMAYKFDKAFSQHEMLKTTMRKQMIDNFWHTYWRILTYKKYGVVVSFCCMLADMDLRKYRDSKNYSDDVMGEYEKAQRALKEIEDEINGV